MRSDLFDTDRRAVGGSDRFTPQNSRMLRVRLGPDVLALKGSMVAFQGDLAFEHQGAGGVGRFVKRVLSGEDTPLMRVSGSGSLYVANTAQHVFVVDLDDEALCVNGTNLLAFDASLDWDVRRLKDGSVWSKNSFTTEIFGRGSVGLSTDGQPVVFDCSTEPVYVDVMAAVAWSASLHPKIVSVTNDGWNLKADSGEREQYAFHGRGFVAVQPSERRPARSGSDDASSASDWDWLAGDD